MPIPPTRALSGRILGMVLLLLLALAVVGTVLVQWERTPEDSPVSRGARLAREAGCLACHGHTEAEPRFNLRLADAPPRPKTMPSLWEGAVDTVDELVAWITLGVPAAEADAHRQLLIRMPAYGDRLSPGAIEDLAAWILASRLDMLVDPRRAAAADPTAPRPAGDALFVAGDQLARATGCYQCHGPLGQGGVANPDSLKGYIPGFQGEDFRKLTAGGDRAEIIHWIEHGRGRAIESGLLGHIARKYLDGQAIPMPGYRNLLSTPEKELLADFLLLLNSTGPLTARETERLTRLLDP